LLEELREPGDMTGRELFFIDVREPYAWRVPALHADQVSVGILNHVPVTEHRCNTDACQAIDAERIPGCVLAVKRSPFRIERYQISSPAAEVASVRSGWASRPLEKVGIRRGAEMVEIYDLTGRRIVKGPYV
jgi:hypothetical protein